MGRISTYYYARTVLDDAIKHLREKMDGGIEEAYGKANQQLANDPDALQGLDGSEMVVAYRIVVANAIIKAWVGARAALVGIILRQNRKRTGLAVSSRNRYKKNGDNKVFPSDSTASSRITHETAKGVRSKYSNRYTPKSKRRIPKMAVLAEHKIGRPSMPEAYKLWKKKQKRARQLKLARERTSIRREEKSWRGYPYPRKNCTAYGWSELSQADDPRPEVEAQKNQALGDNLIYRQKEREAQNSRWKDAH